MFSSGSHTAGFEEIKHGLWEVWFILPYDGIEDDIARTCGWVQGDLGLRACASTTDIWS